MHDVTKGGLDSAANVFQAHGGDGAGALVFRKRSSPSIRAASRQEITPAQPVQA